MDTLLQEIQRRVRTVSADRLDLVATARDLWPRDTLALSQGKLPPLPRAICWPSSHAEVEALLAWASEAGVPLVPYGGGSGVCGGASGREDAVVVDLKRMRRLVRVDREQCVAIAEPGILGQVLEDRLEEQGVATRHSPSSIWCSTPGGWAAARSAGQFSSRYGKFEDMVLALRAAAPAGTITTGTDTPPGEEDLGPLLLGSEGTLGIITRIAMRVVPLPATRWLRGYAFPDLTSAWAAMRAVMQAELWPAVLRLYDPVDTRVGGRLHPPRGERTGPSAWRQILERVEEVDALRHRELATPLAFARTLNRIAGRLGSRVLLIVGWEGEQDVVEAQVAAALPLLAAGEDLGPGPGERWHAHRHDVSYKLSPVFSRGAFADTMEVASTWSRLPDLYREVREALGRHALVMAHFSHAYPEGCSIYFSFAGPARLAAYDAAWKEALEAVRRVGGTVTHHHGVGQLKAEAATRELGHALRVYHARKRRLDPGGILNPGRLFSDAAPPDRGPPPPRGGWPVFALHHDDLLAEVDPAADPEAIRRVLAPLGLDLRIPPDRPLGPWLQAWRPASGDRHEVPFFSLQARFDDGCAARVGLAPRSAAGPDLRLGLLRDARPELVEVPLVRRSRHDVQVTAHPDDPWGTVRDLKRAGMPVLGAQVVGGALTLHLSGPAAGPLAEGLADRLEGAVAPAAPLPPRSPDLVPDPEGTAGATAHHRLAERHDG